MGNKEDQNIPEMSETPLLTDPPFYLPEFEKSYRYIIDEYEVAPKDIAIFMPCAVRKPYSSSPSHQLIRMIISQVLEPSQYHIVIFGTCGIVPAELETMYPYAHYKYMLGKCNDDKVKEDFLRIETERVAGYRTNTASRTPSGSSAKPSSGVQSRQECPSTWSSPPGISSIRLSRKATAHSRKGASRWKST
jgi:predicted RNA-binding protein